MSIDINFDKNIDEFISHLLNWNRVHNLTGAKTKEAIMANIKDSISPLDKIENFNRVLDIGTGAGFPGMIIAIAYPNLDITLVEPRSKRVSFLNFIKVKLKLTKVKVVQKRVEDFKDDSYDLITSRAVTNTKLLFDLSKHLANINTKYLFYKGSSVDSEIDGIKNYEIFSDENSNRNYLYIKEF